VSRDGTSGVVGTGSRAGALTLLGAVGVGLLLELTLDRLVPYSSLRQLIMLAFCNVVVAVSLNVINGMAGQFSIGHAGFIGIGAYTAAIVASHLHGAMGGGEPTFATSLLVVPVSVLLAATVAGVFGVIVGLPSLRLKGDYLAIVTLGFAEIFRLVIATAKLGAPETIGHALDGIGGPHGVVGPTLHALSIMVTSLGGQNGYAGADDRGVPAYAGPFWVVGGAAVVVFLALRLKFSGWGRAVRALREDEIAAAAVGVDPTRYKVSSFVLSAAGGGIAGALIALMRDGTPIVQPDSFAFQASFDAITMVILGGSGSVSGAALGGIFVTFTVKAIEEAQSTSLVLALKERLPALDLNALRMIVYAAVLIALMIVRPSGLLGERELFAKRRAPRGAPPPPPDAEREGERRAPAPVQA
jgi:branched-chain amino acid transport system permease protein